MYRVFICTSRDEGFLNSFNLPLTLIPIPHTALCHVTVTLDICGLSRGSGELGYSVDKLRIVSYRFDGILGRILTASCGRGQFP